MQPTEASELAYSEGARCRHLGLGVTKHTRAKGLASLPYVFPEGTMRDHEEMRRLFNRSPSFPSLLLCGFAREDAFAEWVQGWDDENDRINSRAGGFYPCDRPVA